MFWFWMTLSVCGYSLQGALMVRYVRDMDALSAGFYRNTSLGFSMLPLLYFVPHTAWLQLATFWPPLSVAAFLAALSQWTRFLSLQALPVGVSSAAVTGFNVVLAFGISGLYFNQWLTWPELVLVSLVVVGALALSVGRSPTMEHLKAPHWRHGLFLIMLTSMSLSLAFAVLTYVARELNPLLAAYFWETLIAVFTLPLLGLRWLCGGQALQRVSGQRWWRIFVACAPTALGTVGFAMAVLSGAFALATGVSALSIVLTTLLCVWLYHEKLHKWQYGVIGLTLLAVITLRLLS